MADAERLQAIETEVRASMCETFNMSSGASRVEGRISTADFDFLIDLLGRIRAGERERCAQLHESINPASDEERLNKVPGAGAMGAVIEYRDLIRAATVEATLQKHRL